MQVPLKMIRKTMGIIYYFTLDMPPEIAYIYM